MEEGFEYAEIAANEDYTPIGAFLFYVQWE
jgi:hypothetical protein